MIVYCKTGFLSISHVSEIPELLAKCALSHESLGYNKEVDSVLLKNFLKNFYKTFIRPLLESAFQVWSPSFIKEIALLEKVQRRATELPYIIFNIIHYEKRFRISGLPALDRDLRISRNNKKFEFDIYRKSTKRDNFIHVFIGINSRCLMAYFTGLLM